MEIIMLKVSFELIRNLIIFGFFVEMELFFVIEYKGASTVLLTFFVLTFINLTIISGNFFSYSMG